jgi:hypothetical protein
VKVSYPGLDSVTVVVKTKPGALAALKVSASPDTIEAVEDTESQITATLVDSYGNTRKVADVTVYFGLSGAIAFVGPSEVDTDADGEATTTIRATGSAKADTTATVRATAEGKTGSSTIRFVSGAVTDVVLKISPSSLNLGETADVTARAEDPNGNPIVNANVVFNFDDNVDWDPIGSIDFDPGDYPPKFSDTSAVTDSNGEATVRFIASIEAGTAEISATIAGIESDTKEIVIKAGSLDRVEMTDGEETIRADGESKSFMTWQIADFYGNFVEESGKTVAFSTSKGSLSADEGTTDSNGEVEVELKSTITRGVATVTAKVNRVIGTEEITFGGDAVDMSLSSKPATVFVGDDAEIKVTLKDETGLNAISKGPTVITDIEAQHGMVPWPPLNMNDGDGSLKFTYTAPGSVPTGSVDTIIVTATISQWGVNRAGVSYMITIPITDVPASLSLTPDVMSAPGDGAYLVKVEAKLVDGTGNTIITSPGTPVSFSTDEGTLSDEYGISANVATTSTTTGIATIYVKAPLVPLGTASKLASVIAIGGGVTGDVTITFTASAPAQPVSAVISDEATLDTAGNDKSSFSGGETVIVSATITNTSPSQKDFLVAVQAISPDGIPLPAVYLTVTLDKDQEFSFQPSIVIPIGASGSWTAEVSVFDKFPAAGGTVQAIPATVNFTVS